MVQCVAAYGGKYLVSCNAGTACPYTGRKLCNGCSDNGGSTFGGIYCGSSAFKKKCSQNENDIKKSQMKDFLFHLTLFVVNMD